MEVKVLHMNGGEGETNCAKNSSIQKRIIQTARSAVEEAAVELCSATNFPDKLSVADLGCSSGPNAMSVVTGIVDAVEEWSRQLGRRAPEFQLFLNDLPGNDFNSLFRSLEAFYEKREAASAGGEKELGRCFVEVVAAPLAPSSDHLLQRLSSSCLLLLSCPWSQVEVVREWQREREREREERRRWLLPRTPIRSRPPSSTPRK